MRSTRAMVVLLLLGLMMVLGCEPTQRVVRDDWAMWADSMKAGGANITMGGQDSSLSRDAMSAALSANRQSGYAVRLATYEGAERGVTAYQDTVWARVQGIANVWTVEGDGIISVYAGRYARFDDPDALRLAERVRTIKRGDDDRPFGEAAVVALAGVGTAAGGDPLDLRTYSGRYEYSVQIGFFDVQYQGDRREAAERWVRQLRDGEGQEAYYYHGPHRSMVTLGLFTRRDFVRQGYQEVPGPEIEALRKKYPHNLGNGMTLVQKDKQGKELGEQRSFVVRVP